MRVKYNRTSTLNQEGKRFDLDKEDYNLVLFDKGVSGKIKFSERAKGSELMELVRADKVTEIVVEELSRLGRNTVDVLTTLKEFEERNINVVVKSLGNFQSIVEGKKNPMWGMITSVMSSLYEMERENILERTRAGRIVAVQNGVKMGRPEKSNETAMRFMSKPKSQQILKLLKKDRTYKEIKKITGSSETTISKVKKYSNLFNQEKKKGVVPGQLDLVIESQKEEVKQKHKEQNKIDYSSIKDLHEKIKEEELREIEVDTEEVEITQEMKDNADFWKDFHNKRN